MDDEEELDKAQIILPLRDKQATVGSDVKFSCRAQSIPKNCPVDWFFGDKKLKTNSRITTSCEGELFVLSITNIKLTDAGEYKVVFNTDKDVLKSTAHLDVEGKYCCIF